VSPQKGRRRRGQRRSRREPPPSPSPEERQKAEPLIREGSEVPGILPFRFIFSKRGRRREEGGKEEKRPREPQGRRQGPPQRPTPRGATAPDVSPLSFWRRGQARTHRERPLPRSRSWWQRLTGLHFPPWVPVVAIIIIVFLILGLLFFTRETTGAPRMGDTPRQAAYEIEICGERQPNVPHFPGGVTTDGEGNIIIQPQVSAEEGSGAGLVKWFEYGGGELTKTTMRVPGQKKSWKNGDQCDDGSEGVLQVFVNDERKNDWTRYIPQNGDDIRIVFGPLEAAPTATPQETPTATPQETPTATETPSPSP